MKEREEKIKAQCKDRRREGKNIEGRMDQLDEKKKGKVY